MDLFEGIDVKVNDIENNDREVTLDEVISNTSFASDQANKKESLVGNYVCKLSYEQDLDSYFINHPISDKNIIPIYGATIELHQELDGVDVLVVFNKNDVSQPIITGIMNKCIHAKNVNIKTIRIQKNKEETIVFEAEKEIVFKCGKSSITLTRAGKVLIRGAYLLSRSSGANRIKGGSVHLN